MFYFSLSRLRFYFISRAGLRLVGSQPWLQYIQAFVSFSLSRFFSKTKSTLQGSLKLFQVGFTAFPGPLFLLFGGRPCADLAGSFSITLVHILFLE